MKDKGKVNIMILATAHTMEVMDITHTFMCWSLFYPVYEKRMEVISQSARLFAQIDCGLSLLPV